MTAQFVPMKSGRMKPQVDRTYRESHALQWVREEFINAREAGAKRVHFGIDFNGVASTGTYRRVIADDGLGIAPNDHERFFNTFGSGGKPIGGPHDNYGIGFKTSVLPWNHLGVIVISLSEGIESMSRIYYNRDADEYGMKVESTSDGELESVWRPGADEEFKLNWRDVVPQFVRDAGHGTVIVLLGNTADQDTILGDPNRPTEANVDAIVRYMNSRFWDMTALDISVDAVMTTDKKRWPDAGAKKSGGGRDASWTTLRPLGLFKATIDRDTENSSLNARGTVAIAGGTVYVDWYLRSGQPLPNTRAQSKGFVASLYRGEIYGLSDHAATMRSFGVGAIRDYAFLVLRPPEAEASNVGVYPDTSRTSLKIGGPSGGLDLPMADWAQEFGSRLPNEIIKAIKDSFSVEDGQLKNDEWKKRLQERYGAKWKIPKLIASEKGAQSTNTVQSVGSGGRKSVRSLLSRLLPERPLKSSKNLLGDPEPSGTAAKEKLVDGGLPNFRIVSEDQIGDNKWAIAAFDPPNTAEPTGVLLINKDHRVIRQHIKEIVRRYPEHLSEIVEREMLDVYGELGIAHIAHSEQMKKLMPASEVEANLRSEAALTMALLGLWQVETIALPRLQGKLQQAQIKGT